LIHSREVDPLNETTTSIIPDSSGTAASELPALGQKNPPYLLPLAIGLPVGITGFLTAAVVVILLRRRKRREMAAGKGSVELGSNDRKLRREFRKAMKTAGVR
jgi:hypothetical protein